MKQPVYPKARELDASRMSLYLNEEEFKEALSE